MTAAISFQVDERKDVVKIPNSALRFYPLPKQVRKEDVPILEGTQVKYDESLEPHCLLTDHAERCFAHCRILDYAFAERRHMAANRGQRRPQLVRHRHQEVA